MPTLKIKHSPASINTRLAKLYEEYISDCSMSDQVKHFFPYSSSMIRSCIRADKQGTILDIKLLDGHEEFKLAPELENEFFDILELECIVDVYRNGNNNFTLEQNEQIDIICYCNRLKAAVMQRRLDIPCKIDFSGVLNDEKLSLLINALENYPDTAWHKSSSGWASLAAAFLLADIIETKIDFSEKTTEDIDQYWNKRYHDAISFALKAAESAPAYKEAAHMLLLHIKAVAGEYYPDIKQRMNTVLLEPNIATFNLFKREPVQALLQYKDNFFNMKFTQENEGLNSHENTALSKLENRRGNTL